MVLEKPAERWTGFALIKKLKIINGKLKSWNKEIFAI